MSAFKDFSDAIDATFYTLDLARNLHRLLIIALAPPTLSSFVPLAFPLGLLLIENYALIVGIVLAALFITNYGRSHFVIITFPLVARAALICTRTLFSFRLNWRSLHRIIRNSCASLSHRRRRWLLDWLADVRVLLGRRRRAHHRCWRDIAILVEAYRQSRRNSYACGNQND
ncbi:MAG: hypothetical protein QOJ02_4 [Acidobacteriota bacterium]|nr:hypothetical protein [Acidobacteriota bacterium]